MEKKVFAFDLDGTLTEHRTWITDENLAVLDDLAGRGIRVVIAGAGQTRRIFTQMREHPVDIIGNYGLQYAEYRDERGDLKILRDLTLPCDRESVAERIERLRGVIGFTDYVGGSVEFHPSGCVTFPLLGTKADIADTLLFDPTREKRRAVFSEVAAMFPEYTVFVGGSSSFDMAPAPYDKAYALSALCAKRGLAHDEVLYVGDDYGPGGNDESVYLSDFPFLKIDDYRETPKKLAFLLT